MCVDSWKRTKLMTTSIDPTTSVKLPKVMSYALDIPTDPAELAQFDRSVSSILYRITGCVATKTIKRKRVDAPGDKENVDPQEVAALEENDDQQERESKGYLSENRPGRQVGFSRSHIWNKNKMKHTPIRIVAGLNGSRALPAF